MIEEVIVSGRVLAATEEAIREAGRDGLELFVLWTGRYDDGVFEVRTHHVPEQVSTRSMHGCSVHVDAPALHELNVWLFEHGEALGIQIHSHPTEAYHSDTDDAFPIVTTEGGLSIVVADFGRDGVRSPSSVAYRLQDHRWHERDVRVTVI